MIQINGKAASYTQGLTVEAFLLQEGFKAERVVVELNKQILAKNLYTSTALQDGDCLEVLEFVGGG